LILIALHFALHLLGIADDRPQYDAEVVHVEGHYVNGSALLSLNGSAGNGTAVL
jgi:hypothetical protein